MVPEPQQEQEPEPVEQPVLEQAKTELQLLVPVVPVVHSVGQI